MTGSFLDRVAQEKREEVARARRRESLDSVRQRAMARGPARDFRAALAGHPAPRLICEVKRASPSRGAIRAETDVIARARSYETAGAAAISVLTDGPHFGGSLADLESARNVVGVPLLRKDFVLDPYQAFEARAAGADAILLIVAMLERALLEELYGAANDAGVAVLTEVHDEADLETAVAQDASVIGINNRDLRTLKVSLDASRRLLPLVPIASVAVAESGIRTPAQVRELWSLGARAFLVGEALMELGEDRVGEAVGRLTGATSTEPG